MGSRNSLGVQRERTLTLEKECGSEKKTLGRGSKGGDPQKEQAHLSPDGQNVDKAAS